jgi:hypothetical protein
VPIHQRRWRVRDRNCHYSAFSGYHWTSSNYSSVQCFGCGRIWRTRAAYVDVLPNIRQRDRLK